MSQSSVRTGRTRKKMATVIENPHKWPEPVCQVLSLLEARRGVGRTVVLERRARRQEGKGRGKKGEEN